MATYLDGILAWHRARAASDGRDVHRLIEEAALIVGGRGFSAGLRRHRDATGAAGDGARGDRAGGVGDTAPAGFPAVIAEVKRRSPSKGDLAIDLDPAGVAAEYERGGATCLSVLTDEHFFAGSPGDLIAARAATSLPVLRKDFTVCEADVCDARLMGADCVLLIAAALDDDLLARLLRLAGSVGIEALVEVHDEFEATRALDCGASIIGVNQRDLTTFEVDRARAERLAGWLPASVLKVAESGISTPEDAERLGRAGYDAVLVGEALVRSADRAGAVRRLRGCPAGVSAVAAAVGPAEPPAPATASAGARRTGR